MNSIAFHGNWRRLFGLFVFLVWIAGVDARAGTFNWDADGDKNNGQTDGSGNWKDADGVLRWMNAGVDYQWGNNNNAAFGIVGQGTGQSYTVTNNQADYAIQPTAIIFKGSASYTINGNRLYTPQITVDTGVTSMQYISIVGLEIPTAGAILTLSNNATNNNGTLNVVASIKARSPAANSSLVLNGAGAGTNQISGGIFQDGAGAISVTVGGGVWSFSNATTSSVLSGNVTVNGGKVILASSVMLQSATGQLAIAGGQFATAVTSTTIGGGLSLSAGNMSFNDTSAGTLTLAANQNFTLSGGQLDFTLGTTYDQIFGSGTGMFSLTGGLLQLDVSGTGFSYSNAYSLFNGFSSGSVTGLTIGGYDTLGYTAAVDNTGTLRFTAVPEASTGSLLMGALGLVGLVRWLGQGNRGFARYVERKAIL